MKPAWVLPVNVTRVPGERTVKTEAPVLGLERRLTVSVVVAGRPAGGVGTSKLRALARAQPRVAR